MHCQISFVFESILLPQSLALDGVAEPDMSLLSVVVMDYLAHHNHRRHRLSLYSSGLLKHHWQHRCSDDRVVHWRHL